MSVSAALLLGLQLISVPLGKPKVYERYPAPIAVAGPAFARLCKDDDDWNRPAPPVRLHGNTYFVGTCGISAILVTGKDGHVLIDGGTAEGGELIANNIRRLGFKLSDVRYILSSHEHFDHVGGLSRLRDLTSADVVASAKAADVLRTGRAAADDPQNGVLQNFAPVSVARTVRDGNSIRVGATQLTAYETPGHTAGALSWQWVSCDGGVCRTFVYADSLSPVRAPAYRYSDHPAWAAAFRQSIAKVSSLECDILLTPHPSASSFRTRVAGGGPLLDSQGCKAYAAAKTKALDERRAKEAAAK